MDIRMASLPGCGLGGGGGGGGSSSGNRMVKSYPVKKDNHHTVGPQVKLTCGQPPVLDTTGCKPSTSRPTSGFCRSTRRVGGNIWTSLQNMYNSMRSGPSLTWVNPGIIPEFHTAAAQSSSLETSYSMADALYSNQNQPLWYQATPGSQFEYGDPLQVLSYPFSDTLPPNSSNLSPGSTYCLSKSSQPLNPEAKEWVPSGYKDNKVIKSSITNCSEMPLDINILPKLATEDFIEITESEIDAVRKNSSNEQPKKTQDCLVDESSNKQLLHKKGKATSSCIISQKSSLESESIINQEVSSDVSKDEVLEQLEICAVSAEAKCSAKQQDSLSPSYASITRKSPEPPVNPIMKIAFEGKSISPAECVKQPLPKIFTKDKIYPKEKAPLVMENKKREVLPFKTASKMQKRSSKKFLRDLKESSPVKEDLSFSGSEGSLESTTDIISGFCMARLHCNEFLKEKTESVRSQRSSSESSASSHVRTVSESTAGSVESIDIEFGEDCDIHENKDEDNHVLGEHCKSKSSVEGKYVNSIVAHILCIDESDSEYSDDDSDDGDWDTVQECISHNVDESWETLGLYIPLLTKSLPCSESGNNDKLNISEIVCDNICNSSSLTEINMKWNEEVCRGMADASPSKVSFGEVKVYPLVSWSFAYRNARRGPWEQYARDRSRFNNRVLSLEPIISPVLADNHRKAMYCKLYGL